MTEVYTELLQENSELETKVLRLEQENKDFETLVKSLYKRIEETEKENEASAFRERLYKADYEASEQENKELKEWKEKVVKLFESACRCKYLNEETDICSYTNEKCVNINKCVYKYQELSNTYRSALEEIKRITEEDRNCMNSELACCQLCDKLDLIKDKINGVLGDEA